MTLDPGPAFFASWIKIRFFWPNRKSKETNLTPLGMKKLIIFNIE